MLPVADVKALRRLAAIVTTELGVCLPDHKLAMLHGRLARRLRDLRIDSVSEYCARLGDSGHASAERAMLFDLATTNKTDFFREPAHFTHLLERVLPDLERQRGAAWTCRVWCAGCSTGQEAYTLAMALDDYARTHPGFAFAVHATDISTRVLREARAATYDEDLVEPLPLAWRKRGLLRSREPARGVVRIAPGIRRHVTFDRLNFMAERYALPGELDVVFFRNVLIYFDQATRQQVVQRQCRYLRPGGYLFVGHAENLSGLDLPLVATGSSVWRRT
jgi:chemotaxis protein methyltransferase CheR